MNFIALYLSFGSLWLGGGVLLKFIRIRSDNPVVGLLVMISLWPYILYRMIKNILSGKPNGSVWP